MLRLAQVAAALGAELGPLDVIPDRVAAVLDRPGPLIGRAGPPRRADRRRAERAGRRRRARWRSARRPYVAAEGLSSEQFFHGPSVALDGQDTLVVLDGGGPAAERTETIARVVEVTGAQVARFAEHTLGEALSVFPLTVVVQRIAARAGRGAGRQPGPLPLRGEDPGARRRSRRSGSE